MVFEFVSLAFVGASQKGLPGIYREKIIPGGVFCSDGFSWLNLQDHP